MDYKRVDPKHAYRRNMKLIKYLRGSILPLRFILNLPSSGTSGSVCWFKTDVSELRIGSIFEDKASLTA